MSKSMSNFWPPIVTGDKNSASPCAGWFAATLPVACCVVAAFNCAVPAIGRAATSTAAVLSTAVHPYFPYALSIAPGTLRTTAVSRR